MALLSSRSDGRDYAKGALGQMLREINGLKNRTQGVRPFKEGTWFMWALLVFLFFFGAVLLLLLGRFAVFRFEDRGALQAGIGSWQQAHGQYLNGSHVLGPCSFRVG